MATAYAATLGSFAQTRDVVFGQTTSGRSPDRPESHDTVGLFINTLPVRLRWEGGESPRELAARMQSDFLERQRHEQTPLVDALGAAGLRDFDALYVFENYPVEKAVQTQPSDAGLTLQMRSSREPTHYSVALVASTSGGPAAAAAGRR